MKYTTIIFTLFITLFISVLCRAQMYIGQDTLYGDEWINYDQDYFRINVAEDGIFRIEGQTIFDQAPTMAGSEGQWQLWHNGSQVPLFVSDEANFDEDDFILFNGKKNRCFLDSMLFEDPEDMLNPHYSLINDTSAYYLTKSPDLSQRLDTVILANPTGEENLIEYYTRNELNDYHESFNKKYYRTSNLKIYESEFIDIEGFSHSPQNSLDYDFLLENLATNASAEINIAVRLSSFYTRTNGGASFSIYINDELMDAMRLGSFELLDKTYSIPVSGPSDSTINIRIEESGGVSTDLFLLSSVLIKYPANTVLVDGINHIDHTHDVNDRYVFTNAIAGHQYIFYNLLEDQIAFLNAATEELTFKTQLSRDNFLLVDTEDITSIDQLEEVTFRDYSDLDDTNFLFITSKRLHDPASPNIIDEYLSYRSSAEGGLYKTGIIYIEDLYEQFAYGIRRHPLSLRNFIQHLLAEEIDPEYVTIIGKGRRYDLVRSESDLLHVNNESFFVPAYGFPASDPPLFAKKGSVAPDIPFGRIAVDNLEQLAIYLDKVRTFEQIDPSDQNDPEDHIWRQRILHLEAGNHVQSSILQAFATMENAINNSALKADIHTYSNSVTTTLDSFRVNEVYEKINQGISVLTYYGHSSSTVLNYSFDNADRYDNAARFPLMLALGCSAGDYNAKNIRIAQTYCLMENKGFLNFISTSGLGFVSALGQVGAIFYENYGNLAADLSIGQIHHLTLKQSEQIQRRHVAQLNFFGDPAIKHFYPNEKDLYIDVSSARIEPQKVTVSNEFFDFHFDVISLGNIGNESYILEVRREYPDGTIRTIARDTVFSSGFRSTHTYRIPLEKKISHGINKLFVTVDAADDIEEKLTPESELNNNLEYENGVRGFTFYVPGEQSIPIWPRDKSIVPSGQVDIYAYSDDLQTEKRTYIIELDTSLNFDSPQMMEVETQAHGGLHKFGVTLPTSSAEVVYYWRSKQLGSPFWSFPQSFVHIEGEEGWNTSHYFQFKDFEHNGYEIDISGEWTYSTRAQDAFFSNTFRSDFPGLTLNNSFKPIFETNAWYRVNLGLSVIAFKNRYTFMENPEGGLYGSYNPIESLHFTYRNTDSYRDSLIHFISEVIPEDYHVIFFTFKSRPDQLINASDWAADSTRNNGVNLFNLLEEYGATDIRNHVQSDSARYLFAFTKKDGKLFEELTFENDPINYYFPMTWPYQNGFSDMPVDILYPEEIEKILWSLNQDLGDDKNLNDIRLKFNKSGTYHDVSISNAPEGSYTNPGVIDEEVDDFIFASHQTDQDSVNSVILPANYYRIYGLPIGDYSFEFSSDSLFAYKDIDQGEEIRLKAMISNIHNKQEDITMRYSIVNRESNKIIIQTDTLLHVPVNQTILFTLGLSSDYSTGQHALILHLDPEQLVEEVTRINNYIEFDFQVKPDRTPPLMDVYFDGLMIQAYDIVSPGSRINVHLSDENIYYPLLDTNAVRLTIYQPDGTIYPYSIKEDAQVSFSRSGAEGSSMDLTLFGSFLQEGIYEIVVDARDMSGNTFAVPYHNYFRIVHDKSANFRIYPNPIVNGSLNIEYVITGPEQADVSLEVFNPEGKRVMYISQLMGTYASPGQGSIKLDVTSLNPGQYIYRVHVNDLNGDPLPVFIQENHRFDKNRLKGSFIIL